MTTFTRKQVLEVIKQNSNKLIGADLTKIDLSKTNLSKNSFIDNLLKSSLV